MKTKAKIVTILALLALHSAGLANELYVPSQYGTIQAAINDSNNGDTVIVADGTYTGGGNRDIDFLGKAITVRSTDPNDPNIVAATIIDCNGTEDEPHQGFKFHNGEDANSKLDGLTITNGYSYFDGGIYCYRSSPTIENCIIKNNVSPDGGGIVLWESNAQIKDCLVASNVGTAGILSVYGDSNIIGCKVTENRGSNGSGIVCLYGRIIDCTASKNNGVGIYGCSSIISNCIATKNSIGIDCDNTIVKNTTSQENNGCGIRITGRNATITNCIITGNKGGGIKSSYKRKVKIENCSIVGNSGSNGAGVYCNGSTISLINSILWKNSSQESEIYIKGNKYNHSKLTALYNDIEGGRPNVVIGQYGSIDWGLGNIDTDPCFVELGSGYWDDNNTPGDIRDDIWVWTEGDYHLLRTSPCVDAGTETEVYSDIEGNARPFDFPGVDNNGELPEFDMGAYELVPVEAKMQLTPQTLNCKGKGKWVKAHITIAEGFFPEDVDVNEPAIAYPMEAESEYINVLGGDKGPVRLEVVFGREAFCGSITEDYLDITVIGSLMTGQYFQGTDTIKIITSRRR